jgi:hypothetical protein
MTPWHITWQACFGSISANRVDAIESYVGGKVTGGLQPGELDAVIEQLAERWNPKEHGSAPGIGLLISSIKQARLRAQGIDTEEPYEVAQARRAIQHMPTTDLSRWNAICDMAGRYHQWLDRLIAWARHTGGLIVPWWAPETIKGTGRLERPAGARTAGEVIEAAEDWQR